MHRVNLKPYYSNKNTNNERKIYMFGLTPFEKNFYSPFWSDDFKMPPMPQASSFKTDIRDEGDKFVIEAELPGFKKEEIKADINDNMLTISAERTEEKEEKDSKGNYIRRERTYGSVARSFDISEIKSEEIAASYENGVLTLTLPKKTESVPQNRRLQIN